MITTILFDLDGTLLPMDQDQVIGAYMAGLSRTLASYGFDPRMLAKSIWKGTGAMVANDGAQSNESVFWQVFSQCCGQDMRRYAVPIDEFYRVDFQQLQQLCGFDPRAAETVRELKDMGFRVALATNPLFPAVATRSRIRWAGLLPEEFEYITSYENSSRSKPNPDYYREVLDKLGVKPENCLMVGNDAKEDMVAEELGMHVFLLTDCLINSGNREISRYPQGSFPELMKYVRSACQ